MGLCTIQNAVFVFVVGMFFCLRGGAEHRNLKLSQTRRKNDPDHHENVAKKEADLSSDFT